MTSWFTTSFWATVARTILRNRVLILLIIAGITVFFGFQWKNMRFTYTEANLLPDKHPVNQQYNAFLDVFGEEGNLVILAIKDTAVFNLNNFNAWNKLSKQFNAIPEVDIVVSTDNLQELSKDTVNQEFKLKPFIGAKPKNSKEVLQLKEKLFNELPFFESLLYNKETQTLRTAVYLDKEIVNTAVRKDFIYNDLQPLITNFEEETGLDVHVSGMPYVRTLNEIGRAHV